MPVLSLSAIKTSNVLLVEGKDELEFFGEFLKRLPQEVQTDLLPREVGGKNKFPLEFPAFLNDPGFYKVTSYAIIRDADCSSKSTLQSVQSLLNKYKQPCPKTHAEIASNGLLKVGIFIMPGGSAAKGMLEDLCLQSVQNHPVMPLVDNFIEGLRNESLIEFPKNESKARLQAFLAGMPEIATSIGLAAKKGYWPFEHELFLELDNFLNKLVL